MLYINFYAPFLIHCVRFHDTLLLTFDITLRRLQFPANVRVLLASRLVLALEADEILTDVPGET